MAAPSFFPKSIRICFFPKHSKSTGHSVNPVAEEIHSAEALNPDLFRPDHAVPAESIVLHKYFEGKHFLLFQGGLYLRLKKLLFGTRLCTDARLPFDVCMPSRFIFNTPTCCVDLPFLTDQEVLNLEGIFRARCIDSLIQLAKYLCLYLEHWNNVTDHPDAVMQQVRIGQALHTRGNIGRFSYVHDTRILTWDITYHCKGNRVDQLQRDHLSQASRLAANGPAR